MPTCPKCQAEVKPGARFCGSCGAEQPSTPACPQCGAAMPPGAKFCGKCGAPLASAAPAPKPSPVQVAPTPAPEAPPAEAALPRKKSSGSLATAIVFCILYIAAAIGFGAGGGALIADNGLERMDLETGMGLAFAALALLYLISAISVWPIRPRFWRGFFLALFFLAVLPGAVLGAGYIVDTYMASGETMYFRGVNRLHGIYSRFDDEEAVVWFQRGMRKGDPRCVERMAYCYRYGIGGLPADPAKAIELYKQAGEGGVARAWLALGTMVYRGQGASPGGKPASYFWDKGRRELPKAQRQRLAEKADAPYIVVGTTSKSGRVPKDIRPQSSGYGKGETVVYGPDIFLECQVFLSDYERHPDDGGF